MINNPRKNSWLSETDCLDDSDFGSFTIVVPPFDNIVALYLWKIWQKTGAAAKEPENRVLWYTPVCLHGGYLPLGRKLVSRDIQLIVGLLLTQMAQRSRHSVGLWTMSLLEARSQFFHRQEGESLLGIYSPLCRQRQWAKKCKKKETISYFPAVSNEFSFFGTPFSAKQEMCMGILHKQRVKSSGKHCKNALK